MLQRDGGADLAKWTAGLPLSLTLADCRECSPCCNPGRWSEYEFQKGGAMAENIELAKAIAWPISSVLVALLVFLSIARVSGRNTEFDFGIKDWFKFAARGRATPGAGRIASC